MRLVQQKNDLRSSFRQRAELFQAHQCAHLVERLNENLICFLKTQSGTWAAFKGCGFEPRLDKVILSTPHIDWVYPKVEEHELHFFKSTKFKEGRFGIEEPDGGTRVHETEIHGFLIPGLAFDRTGARLGRGKGFYDRALCKNKSLRIGVSFSFQIFEGFLPCQSFDAFMDLLISDQGVLHFDGIEKGI